MIDKDENASIDGEFESKSVIKEIDSRFHSAEKRIPGCYHRLF
jgi:hypothetical protein